MISGDEETDLIRQLKADYNAKVIVVDSMVSLSKENLSANNDYIMIMNEFIDNIRNTTAN